MAYRAEIPYGVYWSTPFAKWQGSLAGLNAVQFAAHTAKAELAKRQIDPKIFDYGALGMTVPQHHSFYGLPWLTGMIGAKGVGGPTLSQACATGARTLLAGAQEIESGMASASLLVTCDRTSNGPHIYYPNPRGPGGTGGAENWVLDNFSDDPLGHHAMVETAENVARKHQIPTVKQHEIVLRRQEQYRQALANDRAFQKRYMTLPFAVPSPDYRKTIGTMAGDEGITESTSDGLAKLRPVKEGGTVTFGGQTHPADGNAAIVLAAPEKARDMSRDPKIRIRLLGFGLARAELAYMPEATVPAAKRALDQAGITIKQVDAVTSHNPFAVNDIVFAKETGFDVMAMNNYGCSLIWGHPQGPTGTRSIIELIEELALRGGGIGLFEGCAAGDTAMAVALKVGD
ncbi:MAG: thiolase family protein [Alphaproteobacteria bacterium]|nr:thiolase family protein [Alphaproteobacteria bacterium]